MKRKFDLTLDLASDPVREVITQLAGRENLEGHQLLNRFRRLLGDLSGTAEALKINGNVLEVTWIPDREVIPLREIGKLLEKGAYPQAVVLMELFLSAHPDHPRLLYNLGLAYSDLGKLPRAITLLRQFIAQDVEDVNGLVALGVALMRAGNGPEAENVLRQTIQLGPENPWAHRNLGAVLLNLEKWAEAIHHFLRATELNPRDEMSWYGLGQAYENAGEIAQADQAYLAALEINEFGNLAEGIREARSRLAHKTFRATQPSAVRMDAVMYCLGALEKYETLSNEEIQKIGFEIAMLGTQGIDVNDASVQYTLRSLPGSFSGLHLLSLQYVAFKLLFPTQDIGFDLENEYQAAQRMFQGGQAE